MDNRRLSERKERRQDDWSKAGPGEYEDRWRQKVEGRGMAALEDRSQQDMRLDEWSRAVPMASRWSEEEDRRRPELEDRSRSEVEDRRRYEREDRRQSKLEREGRRRQDVEDWACGLGETGSC